MDRLINIARELCREKAQRINKREIISFDSASEILDELWAYAELNDQYNQIAGIFSEYESERYFTLHTSPRLSGTILESIHNQQKNI